MPAFNIRIWLTVGTFSIPSYNNIKSIFIIILVPTTTRKVTALRSAGGGQKKKQKKPPKTNKPPHLSKQAVSTPKTKQKVIVCFFCARQVQGEKRKELLLSFSVTGKRFFIFYSKRSSLSFPWCPMTAGSFQNWRLCTEFPQTKGKQTRKVQKNRCCMGSHYTQKSVNNLCTQLQQLLMLTYMPNCSRGLFWWDLFGFFNEACWNSTFYYRR